MTQFCSFSNLLLCKNVLTPVKCYFRNIISNFINIFFLSHSHSLSISCWGWLGATASMWKCPRTCLKSIDSLKLRQRQLSIVILDLMESRIISAPEGILFNYYEMSHTSAAPIKRRIYLFFYFYIASHTYMRKKKSNKISRSEMHSLFNA